MNITELQLCLPRNNSNFMENLRLPLRGVESSQPYVIKAATGLDPDEVHSQYLASVQGVKKFKMGVRKRVVSLLIGLQPQYDQVGKQTASELRDNIYRMISYDYEGDLELRFMRGANDPLEYVASLFGRVTKVEAGLFNPETEVQVTFEADYPMLRSTQYEALNSGGGRGGQQVAIINDLVSTAPHGFTMGVIFEADVPLFGMSLTQGGPLIFAIDFQFKNQDELYFSSEEGERQLYVKRWTGPLVVTNSLGSQMPTIQNIPLNDKLRVGAIWPLLYPGTNWLWFETGRSSAGTPTSFGIYSALVQHRATYWGV